jgi:hypothetical protein
VTKTRLLSLLFFAAMVASIFGQHHPGVGGAWPSL